MKAVGVAIQGTEKSSPPYEGIKEGEFSAEPHMLEMEQEPFEIDGCETLRGNASGLLTHANIVELSGLNDGICRSRSDFADYPVLVPVAYYPMTHCFCCLYPPCTLPCC